MWNDYCADKNTSEEVNLRAHWNIFILRQVFIDGEKNSTAHNGKVISRQNAPTWAILHFSCASKMRVIVQCKTRIAGKGSVSRKKATNMRKCTHIWQDSWIYAGACHKTNSVKIILSPVFISKQIETHFQYWTSHILVIRWWFTGLMRVFRISILLHKPHQDTFKKCSYLEAIKPQITIWINLMIKR